MSEKANIDIDLQKTLADGENEDFIEDDGSEELYELEALEEDRGAADRDVVEAEDEDEEDPAYTPEDDAEDDDVALDEARDEDEDVGNPIR